MQRQDDDSLRSDSWATHLMSRFYRLIWVGESSAHRLNNDSFAKEPPTLRLRFCSYDQAMAVINFLTPQDNNWCWGLGGIACSPKWRPSFSRICLHSLCEREKLKKITIFVCTFYGAVSRNRLQAKMAVGFFPYTPTQLMWAWETQKNHHLCMYFLWGSF